ncbi:MAG: hypothetical protein AB8B82_16765 [Roseovarius sp.]
MRFLLVFVLGLCGMMAEAGPWPRDKGAGFLSFSTEYDDEDDAFYTALFGEYGVTPKLTAGVDLGFSDDTLYKAVGFARYPLVNQNADWRVAVELGAGVTDDEGVLRPGLHFGRGLNLGQKSGWFTIETFAYYQIEQDDVEVSTDITLGVNMTDRRKLILQLQNGNQPMDPDYLNLTTSLVVEAKPGLHVELGMKAGLQDEGKLAVKLGVWHSF